MEDKIYKHVNLLIIMVVITSSRANAWRGYSVEELFSSINGCTQSRFYFTCCLGCLFTFGSSLSFILHPASRNIISTYSEDKIGQPLRSYKGKIVKNVEGYVHLPFYNVL